LAMISKEGQFGRKPVLDAGERRKIADRYAAGETIAELARDYDEKPKPQGGHGE
jgi:hypothetical protein